MADQEEIFGAVRDQLVEVLDVDPGTVALESRFDVDLDADSVDVIEMTGAIERRYDIQIEDHEVYDLTTVGEVVALVAGKVDEKG